MLKSTVVWDMTQSGLGNVSVERTAPFSEPRSKPSKIQVGNKQEDHSVCCLLLPWLNLPFAITLHFFVKRKPIEFKRNIRLSNTVNG
jgi:hypothetical protein